MAGSAECARKNGLLGGRPKGATGAQVKKKILEKWEKIFNEKGVSILEDLAEKNKTEFMKIGVSLSPKEIDFKTDLSNLTEEQLDDAIKNALNSLGIR